MNPSQRIDQLIADLTDWRGKTLASIRKSILEADREIIEEWKWMGSPVWSRDGNDRGRHESDGQGSDDGFGVAAILGAAHALVRSGLRPARTLRFVLFTGEEEGLLGSRAYVRQHAAELGNIVAVFALDWGAGPWARRTISTR
jgi:hypothetical protein